MKYTNQFSLLPAALLALVMALCQASQFRNHLKATQTVIADLLFINIKTIPWTIFYFPKCCNV